MKKILILSSIIIAVIILSLKITVNALETGTINFTAINNTDSAPVENLEIAIYQIGYTENENFNLSSEFENCTINLNDFSESNLNELKTFAQENATPIYTETTDSNGKFTLNNVTLGIYLFVQTNKTDSITMQTMLISVPDTTSESSIEYTITVKPKISTIEETTETEPEPETETGTKSKNETENKGSTKIENNTDTEIVTDDTLPQTGVLSWPIPILVAVGLITFCATWLKVFSASKKKVKLQ